jgi:tetratricopeptide (TPR) repeat protein
MEIIKRPAAVLFLLLAGGCGGGDAVAVHEGLIETALPDLSRLQPFGQAQVSTRVNALNLALESPGTAATALGQAFGAVGQILLAADELDTAAAYLQNAITLAPTEPRWPYYLGHLHRLIGDLDAAASSFEIARNLDADNAATRMWLGVMYAALDRPTDAIASYTDALTLEPNATPTLIGLGELELAQGESELAIGHLETALATDPGATMAHAVLARAYAQLGNDIVAATHAAQQGASTGRLNDPLMTELPALLETAQTFENRAFLAANDGNWEEAVAQFRQAAALQPGDRSIQMNLGTALVNTGDGTGARLAFLAAERAEPENPDAKIALGTLYVIAGRYREAIERFELAAALEPSLVQARLSLADTLRQTDRPAAAVAVYAALLTEDESLAAAQFGLAISLVQLERWGEAVEMLLDGVDRYPEDPRFGHAAARLLSTSPDDAARDGLLALQIMSVLIDVQPTNPEVGETMAMTMAENGIWVDALNWQRGTIDGAREGGAETSRIEWLAGNLARYERNEPARVPWPPDHAIFQPGGPPQPYLLP